MNATSQALCGFNSFLDIRPATRLAHKFAVAMVSRCMTWSRANRKSKLLFNYSDFCLLQGVSEFWRVLLQSRTYNLEQSDPVVRRRLDSTHRINCYPADKCQQNKPRYPHPLDSDLSAAQRYPPVKQLEPAFYPRTVHTRRQSSTVCVFAVVPSLLGLHLKLTNQRSAKEYPFDKPLTSCKKSENPATFRDQTVHVNQVHTRRSHSRRVC